MMHCYGSIEQRPCSTSMLHSLVSVVGYVDCEFEFNPTTVRLLAFSYNGARVQTSTGGHAASACMS